MGLHPEVGQEREKTLPTISIVGSEMKMKLFKSESYKFPAEEKRSPAPFGYWTVDQCGCCDPDRQSNTCSACWRQLAVQLHNVDYIAEKDIRKDDTVIVYKAGAISLLFYAW